MINILHIVPDDKFIDFEIQDFERYENVENRFVLLNETAVYKFIYIKNTNIVDTVVVNSDVYLELISDTSIDIVFFHSLGFESAKQFLKDLIVKPIIFWIIWGWDYIPLIGLDLIKPKTKELLKIMEGYEYSSHRKNTIFRNIFTRFIKGKIKYLKNNHRIIKEKLLTELLYNKIDFCSCVVPTEFKLLNKIPGFRALYMPYIIGEDSDPFVDIDLFEPLGDAIWIGNSYTLSNNHLDVFYQLKELNLTNEIIVPLSYGLNIIEHPELLLIGKEIFGERFIPIIDFIPFEEYNHLLKRANIAIFNHIRQQAVGNIIMMMWQGAKVFLSELSPVYNYFIGLGAFIFSVEKDLNYSSINSTLTIEQIKLNRKIVYQIYSKEAIEITNQNTIEFLIEKVRKKRKSNHVNV